MRRNSKLRLAARLQQQTKARRFPSLSRPDYFNAWPLSCSLKVVLDNALEGSRHSLHASMTFPTIVLRLVVQRVNHPARPFNCYRCAQWSPRLNTLFDYVSLTIKHPSRSEKSYLTALISSVSVECPPDLSCTCDVQLQAAHRKGASCVLSRARLFRPPAVGRRRERRRGLLLARQTSTRNGRFMSGFTSLVWKQSKGS